jgi:small subunit ribosomal protein S1
MVENKETLNMDNEDEFLDDSEEMEQSFEDLFESSLKELHSGNVVKGTIVQVNPDSVIVDVGGKSEGVIPVAEFTDEQGQIEVKVGDVFDVLI